MRSQVHVIVNGRVFSLAWKHKTDQLAGVVGCHDRRMRARDAANIPRWPGQGRFLSLDRPVVTIT